MSVIGCGIWNSTKSRFLLCDTHQQKERVWGALEADRQTGNELRVTHLEDEARWGVLVGDKQAMRDRQ